MSTSDLSTYRDNLRGLYVITDTALIPDDQFSTRVAAALRGGARIVQYRDKRDAPDLRLKLATDMVRLCREHGALSIINDDVELAARVGADGVHIGKDDAALNHARERLGQGAIIGVSCYNRLDLALEAEQQGADYVAFGAFFPSRTKPDAVPATLELLATAKQKLHVPLCAIGGITLDNAAPLVSAGADMLAVISAVFAVADIEAAARQFVPWFDAGNSSFHTEKSIEATLPAGYDYIRSDIIELLNTARKNAARNVNALMTASYWEIGRRIVEAEQRGQRRAGYGEQLVERLSIDLTQQFGRGFSRQNVWQMRQFFLTWGTAHILQTLSGESGEAASNTLSETVSRKFKLDELTGVFILPWSAYVRLLSVKDPHARHFYESEALRGGWSVRQLDRQIGSQFYERTALSINKAAMLTKGALAKPEDAISPDEAIKDPYVLEFLNLKDEYSEADLEEALIQRLEAFLLELGSDFTFVGRQRRLRIDQTWYRVDLLFFHRRLRCLVIIDLKLSSLTHADVGQMHMYCNYAKEHWTLADENPPVGLILCADKGHALARYALEGLPNKIMAANYKMILPDAELLQNELEKTRTLLENRTKQ